MSWLAIRFVSRLYIAHTRGGKALKKEGPIWALGAMSGTSLDGIDAALIHTDGHYIHGFGSSVYRGYRPRERETLRKALGQWPGDAAIAPASDVIETTHETLLSQFNNVELVGFHGQTVAHEPAGRGTHQLGDGRKLADALGLPVVWDFRTADMALGGQGAPLAPFFHFACTRWIDESRPLAFLNLGGVGNITFVDPGAGAPEEPGALLAFDTGPANAILNDFMHARRGLNMDRDGALAREGKIDCEKVDAFLASPYFPKAPPKSLDRDDFAGDLIDMNHLSDADGAATLTEMIAASVKASMQHAPFDISQLLITGGGRENPTIMRALKEKFDCPVRAVDAVGLDGDMLEAQAFGYLAVRVARGLPTSCPSTTGVSAAVGGGQISYPNA